MRQPTSIDYNMKNLKKTASSLLLIATLLAVGASRSFAHYDHDDKGWYDEHHHHHAFIYHNHHRGYWDTDPNGVKIFINV